MSQAFPRSLLLLYEERLRESSQFSLENVQSLVLPSYVLFLFLSLDVFPLRLVGVTLSSPSSGALLCQISV